MNALKKWLKQSGDKIAYGLEWGQALMMETLNPPKPVPCKIKKPVDKKNNR